MCSGLEPIRKRFPLYPFLRQDGFIALILEEEEREKATRRLRKRPHLPEPGGEGESAPCVAGRPGPSGCTTNGRCGVLAATAFLPDSYCSNRGSDGEKQGKYNLYQPFPTSCFLKLAFWLCAFLEIERAMSTAKNMRLGPAVSLEIQKGWDGLSLP